MSTPIPPDRSPHSRRGQILVNVFGKTDVGRTREHNEDSFVVADLSTGNATLQPEVRQHTTGPRGSLFMVADGMGGAAAGEIASAMATEEVLKEMQRMWVEGVDRSPSAFARALKHAAKAANTRINSYAVAHPENRGMGTTATIAGLLQDTVYVAQIGDSRGYIIRDGVGIQITKDQSLMQKLVEAGELTEEEAEHSERRNIILQALGPEASIKVDLTHQALRRGDTLVLCSDGLSTQISRDRIAEIVNGESDLTVACRKLIDAANAAGGPDNITVIVARFDGDGLVETGDSDGEDPEAPSFVRHRPFPLEDSGQAMAVLNPGDQNETTQPIPVMSPFSRPSQSADGTVGEITLGEPVAAIVAPFDSSANAPLENLEGVGVQSGSDEDDMEEDDAEEGGSGTGRLIVIFIGVMVVLAGLWFAWTKFGKQG
ncbi:MAG: Stp1/IreP family PP2C-type Ser/Thr phosphatase [Gemmatimonadaceae bacterium]